MKLQFYQFCCLPFTFQVHRSPVFSRLLHFVLKNPLWGRVPQLIKMLMSWHHMGWKLELNRSEESQTLCALANSNYRQYSWQGCVHTWNPFLVPFKDPYNVLKSSGSGVGSPHKGQLMDVLEDGGMEICIMVCLFHLSHGCIISSSFPQRGHLWGRKPPGHHGHID